MEIRRILCALIVGVLPAALTMVSVQAQEAQHYVLDAYGGVHAGGGAPVITPATPYFGFDVAADITYVPAHQTQNGESGILVLDNFGGVHAGGALASDPPSGATPYFGFDAARAIAYRDRRPQVFSAVVSGSGNLIQGSDAVVSAQRLSAGSYRVTFDRLLRGCAWTASVGLVSTGVGHSSLSPIAVTIRSAMYTGGQGVIYQAARPDDTAIDVDTHLIVTCPQP